VKGIEYIFTYMLASNTIFDLFNNNLVGEIPTSICNLRMLCLLNLSWNKLEGKIPTLWAQFTLVCVLPYAGGFRPTVRLELTNNNPKALVLDRGFV